MGNKVLFCISSSFGRSIATGDAESIDCLLRLIDSRKRGLLLIYASKRTVDVIIGYFESISDLRNAQIFRTISNKFRQKKQLLQDLTRFTLIRCSKSNTSRQRWNFISVTPHFVNSSNIFYPPILLGESLSDCDLYAKRISKYFTSGIATSLIGFQLSDRFEPGGGNNTHISYSTHKEKNIDLCFCIVDSDRVSPDSAPGDTAKFVKKVDIGGQSLLCKHLMIDVYSVENLLPINEIERQFVKDKNKDQIEDFKKIKEIRKTSSWKHLPLKRGFKGGDFKKGKKWSYWAKQLETIGQKIPCCDTPNCNCIVIPSISDKALATALKNEDIDWMSCLNNEDNPVVRADYMLISRELRSWLCVGSPIRA